MLTPRKILDEYFKNDPDRFLPHFSTHQVQIKYNWKSNKSFVFNISPFFITVMMYGAVEFKL